jgi:hypothetical protein
MLTAHLRQARTLLRRVHDSEEIGTQLEDLVKTRGFPERAIPSLFDATMRYRIRNATYRAVAHDFDEVETSDATASRDLRRSVVAGHDQRDDTDPFARAPDSN